MNMNLMTNNVLLSRLHALLAVHLELESFTDLRPRQPVNDAFRRLVELVLNTPDDLSERVLADSAVRELGPRLRSLCGTGEAELELAWARRIAGSARPHRELALFPYLHNYRLLSSMESTVLSDLADRPLKTLAFAGSGPMPLSAHFLARDLGVPVDNVDRDAGAVSASTRLCAALGWRDLRFRHADIATVDLSGYDVVVLAALVGSTAAEKEAVLARVAASMTPGALLLVRSAHGLRTLLYPEVGTDALDGMDVLTVVHPVDEVINSVIVARIRGAVPVPRAESWR